MIELQPLRYIFIMSKVLVIYQSLSGNTKKIAEAIAQGAKTKYVKVNEVEEKDLTDAEIIFLGSGIYMGQHHRQLLDLVNKLKMDTKVYIFSTAGMPWLRFLWHRQLKQRLVKRKIKIIGEVCFKGFDTFGPLKFFRGINQDRPNEKDLEKAREIGEKFI